MPIDSNLLTMLSFNRLIKRRYLPRASGHGQVHTIHQFAERTCLKCSEVFESDHPGHRICGRCEMSNRQYGTAARRGMSVAILVLLAILPVAWTDEFAGAKKSYLIKAKLTAYCACVKCCGDFPGKIQGQTASGTMAKAGRTLALPKFFPFGAEVWDGDMLLGICEDRGGAIKIQEDIVKIDVYYGTHAAALAHGVKEKVLLVVVR